MAQPREVGDEQTVAHEIGERHNAFHPKRLSTCFEVLQVFRDKIVHRNGIAFREMQTLCSVIRQNHILPIEGFALPIADSRHERIAER